MRGEQSLRPVGLLSQRRERAARPKGTLKDVVGGAFVLGPEPTSMAVGMHHFEDRPVHGRAPPTAIAVAKQVLKMA